MKITDAFDRLVTGFLDGATVLGGIVAAVFLYRALTLSAVESSTNAVVALCFVVIPYCLSAVAHRSIERDRWK